MPTLILAALSTGIGAGQDLGKVHQTNRAFSRLRFLDLGVHRTGVVIGLCRWQDFCLGSWFDFRLALLVTGHPCHKEKAKEP
jgi:hypothetical protein